jgi:hypothetical protein
MKKTEGEAVVAEGDSAEHVDERVDVNAKEQPLTEAAVAPQEKQLTKEQRRRRRQRLNKKQGKMQQGDAQLEGDELENGTVVQEQENGDAVETTSIEVVKAPDQETEDKKRQRKRQNKKQQEEEQGDVAVPETTEQPSSPQEQPKKQQKQPKKQAAQPAKRADVSGGESDTNATEETKAKKKRNRQRGKKQNKEEVAKKDVNDNSAHSPPTGHGQYKNSVLKHLFLRQHGESEVAALTDVQHIDIRPVRQPRGPPSIGSKGFSAEYIKSRKIRA